MYCLFFHLRQRLSCNLPLLLHIILFAIFYLIPKQLGWGFDDDDERSLFHTFLGFNLTVKTPGLWKKGIYKLKAGLGVMCKSELHAFGGVCNLFVLSIWVQFNLSSEESIAELEAKLVQGYWVPRIQVRSETWISDLIWRWGMTMKTFYEVILNLEVGLGTTLTIGSCWPEFLVTGGHGS